MKQRLFSVILSLVLALSLAVPALAAPPVFSDVPAAHWAHNAIQAAEESGIVTGYEDGTFRPGDSVTNAQFTVIITRLLCPEEVEEWRSKSPDHLNWYWPNMFVALRRNYLKGASFEEADSNTLEWDDSGKLPITRYDMAQILYNVMGTAASSDSMHSAQEEISDWASIPSGYRDAVAACYDLGLLTGMSDSTFSGAQAMTRAQACTVAARLQAQMDNLPPAPAWEEHPPAETAPAEEGDEIPAETAPQEAPADDPPAQPLSAGELCAEVISLVNQERAKEGLAPLGTFDTLTEAAAIRAPELIQLFSHTRPDGSDCFTALDETGASQGIYTAGENIAAGQSTPEAVMESWMNSTGHRGNILSPDFTHIGVGYVRSDTGYGCYWVQLFVGK